MKAVIIVFLFAFAAQAIDFGFLSADGLFDIPKTFEDGMAENLDLNSTQKDNAAACLKAIETSVRDIINVAKTGTEDVVDMLDLTLQVKGPLAGCASFVSDVLTIAQQHQRNKRSFDVKMIIQNNIQAYPVEILANGFALVNATLSEDNYSAGKSASGIIKILLGIDRQTSLPTMIPKGYKPFNLREFVAEATKGLLATLGDNGSQMKELSSCVSSFASLEQKMPEILSKLRNESVEIPEKMQILEEAVMLGLPVFSDCRDKVKSFENMFSSVRNMKSSTVVGIMKNFGLTLNNIQIAKEKFEINIIEGDYYHAGVIVGEIIKDLEKGL